MSLTHIDPSHIQCYKFTNSDKIISTRLKFLMKQDTDELVLVKMPFFGIDDVFSLINLKTVKGWLKFLSDTVSEETMLSLTRILGDSPICDGINLKTKSIITQELSYADWIMLYQLYNLLRGMNTIADTDIEYDLQIGKVLDNPDIDFGKLCFTPECNFKYIICYEYSYEFTNSLNEIDLESNDKVVMGIFIQIPEFNCWQYLSVKKFKTFNKPNNIEVKYATTDSPRCFSRAAYSNLYSLTSIDNIIRYSIYIPVDIYFRKEFEDSNGSISNKTYDAIEIVCERENYTTSVLLTHDELGIDSIRANLANNKILYMQKFWLLKLINNVIRLKPY